MMQYRVQKGKRQTPCCGVNIRVKIAEPGTYERKCDVCRRPRFYVLEPSIVKGLEDVLHFRWVSAEEAAELTAASKIDGPDLSELL